MPKNVSAVQYVAEMSQNMNIVFDDSEDQLSYLKRYVVDQGTEILSLKRKLNYVLKFIGVTQVVDEFDCDENYSPIYVANKWCQQIVVIWLNLQSKHHFHRLSTNRTKL